MINREWHELLLRSMNEELSAEEATELNEALTTSEALRLEKAKLLQMQTLLELNLAEEDASFVDRVMDKLQTQKQLDVGGTILQLFPKVAAACLLVFAVTLISIYLMEGSLSMESIIGLQDLSVEDTITLVDY